MTTKAAFAAEVAFYKQSDGTVQLALFLDGREQWRSPGMSKERALNCAIALKPDLDVAHFEEWMNFGEGTFHPEGTA